MKLLTQFLLFSVISSLALADDFQSVNDINQGMEALVKATKMEAPCYQCTGLFENPKKEFPPFKELYPFEGSDRTIEVVNGEDLIKYMEERMYQANHRGEGGFDEACALEIQKESGKAHLILMDQRSSVKKYPISREEIKKLPPSEKDRVTIHFDRKYRIVKNKSPKVIRGDDFDKDFPHIEMFIERIETENKQHLFFSLTSPQYPANHTFQKDFYDCSFGAALY